MHFLAELLSCRQSNRKSRPKETGVVVRRRNIFIESEKIKGRKENLVNILYCISKSQNVINCVFSRLMK